LDAQKGVNAGREGLSFSTENVESGTIESGEPILVAGEWKTSECRAEIRSPYDGTVVGNTWLASADDLERGIAAAANDNAEIRWTAIPLAGR
jgi:hypothetical protein